MRKRTIVFCIMFALCLTSCGTEKKEPLEEILQQEKDAFSLFRAEELQKKEVSSEDVDYLREEEKYTWSKSNFITFQKKFAAAINQTKYKNYYRQNVLSGQLPDYRMAEEFEDETIEYVSGYGFEGESDLQLDRDAMLKEDEDEIETDDEEWENTFCDNNVILSLRSYAASVLREGQKKGVLPKAMFSSNDDIILEINSLERRKISEEDYLEYFGSDEYVHNTVGEYSLLDEYTPVKYKNCIFFQNKKKELVVDAFRVLLSKDEEFKRALEREGIPWVYQMIEEYETEIWQNPGILKKHSMWNFFAKRGNGNGFAVCESSDAFGIVMSHGQKILKSLCWMDRIRKEDAWDIASFVEEENYTMLEYQYSQGISSLEEEATVGKGSKRFCGEYHLYLLGNPQEKKIEEVIFQKKDTKNGVPEILQQTMSAYLQAIGASEKEVKALLMDLPKEEGIFGNLCYKTDVEKGIYRFYLK